MADGDRDGALIGYPAMKYLAIAVLLALLIGAALHFIDHRGNLPPAEPPSGWMQR